MARCPHGHTSGYCPGCGRVIRPTVAERDLLHYMNAPDDHRTTCERCKRIAEALHNGQS